MPEPLESRTNISTVLSGSRKIASLFAHASIDTKTHRLLGVVADFLADCGFIVLILGSKINNQLLSIDRQKHVDLVGKTTITDLMYIVRSSSLVVSNDSFGAHLGVGYRVPTIVFFCSTDDHHQFFEGDLVLKIVPEYLTCWPCSFGSRKSCPIRTYECTKYQPPLDMIRDFLRKHGLVS